ncbi:16S rRNA (guanine(966)-N(2))-methyltransferase RsmD [Cyanobium sp. Lug-B]|uniref:16S rRNA (guanine(966)-N(2))-methyltransferase RsmD n=1 Tax=Cyanobium sp. Lug-B TaxID=2823716 RepID=UPI0020CF9CE2|nr:16S rRNA (guanine(966)-N(2))-methyltransferase RsmD [Cyanobium sp. Lug-B]MCP9797362.1 16S rRNA (guanine(966)-N(2))-methyltransferase RsmD [Cyanobium sp. Lug-B]
MTLRLSGGRRLQSPPGSTARPTASRVRLAVMNLLAARVPGSRWLDLCCGSGVMACEALQRGASEVVAVERDRRIAAVARANLELVRRDLPPSPEASPRCRVDGDEVLRWLARRGEAPFDLIYADPPYAAGLYGPIAAAVLSGGWLVPGGILVWECASDAVPELPPGWQGRDQRRYGGTTVVLLEAPAAAGQVELTAACGD